MRRLAIGLFAAVAAMTFVSIADAHHPDRGFAEQRVLDTNFDGACGRPWAHYCVDKHVADCGDRFGEHSRLCYGRYTAGISIHWYTCDWWGRVEHSGRVVEHTHRCK